MSSAFVESLKPVYSAGGSVYSHQRWESPPHTAEQPCQRLQPESVLSVTLRPTRHPSYFHKRTGVPVVFILEVRIRQHRYYYDYGFSSVSCSIKACYRPHDFLLVILRWWRRLWLFVSERDFVSLKPSHLFAPWLLAPSFPAHRTEDMNDTNPSAMQSYLQILSLPPGWTGWLTCLPRVSLFCVLCLSLIHYPINLHFFHLLNDSNKKKHLSYWLTGVGA